MIGIIVTGVLIGSANAERLYDSAAFIVKMLALIAGIILTYGVSRPVAAADGAVGAAVQDLVRDRAGDLPGRRSGSSATADLINVRASIT